METNNLYYSYSPHIKSSRTTKRIMQDVCIALLPATVMGVVYFGLNAFLLVALSVVSAVASEFIFYIVIGKTLSETAKQFDFTSVVTGLLIGLTLGPQYPLYTPIFGSAFAVIVVKLLFGGTGKNLVNPAIAGRIFIFISFQWAIGTWVNPLIGSVFGITAETSPTVVTVVYEGSKPQLSIIDLFLGTGLSGCIGETCKPALIVGGLYLAFKKIINIGLPTIYIAATGLLTVAVNGFDFSFFLPSILSGGLFIGAIFMATDYVTTPNTVSGNIIYFVFLGILTAVLRQATQMEVVSFAILLMNLTVPLIDKFIINTPFGYVRKKNKEKAQ